MLVWSAVRAVRVVKHYILRRSLSLSYQRFCLLDHSLMTIFSARVVALLRRDTLLSGEQC